MRQCFRLYAPVLMTLLFVFTASAGTITGSATYRERIALPPDAAFKATMEDISRADAPATVIGRVDFMPASPVPIQFEIPYREADIQPGHRYGVRARLTTKGRLLFATTQAHPVLMQEADQVVGMLLLQRVADTRKPDRSLTNTYWKLTELRGVPVKTAARQHEPHLILQAEGQRLAGSGGCNRLMGSYQLNGQTLALGKVASTMMACPDGMEEETAFFRILEHVQAWKVQADQLDLLDESGRAIARFVAVDLK